MALAAHYWMRKLLLFISVLNGLSLAPSSTSLFAAHVHSFDACHSDSTAAPACFVLSKLVPCLTARFPANQRKNAPLCIDHVLRTQQSLVRRCTATLSRKGQARCSSILSGGLQMIMPGGSGFEEAEEVAKRLFRLKTAVQRDDGKFDGNKRTAAATNRGGDQDDNGEKIVVEIELRRPLGFALKEVAGYGIYVDSVMAGGSAEKMGVQRGDRVLATSATVGGGMWEKSTMDGVLSALHSGTLFSNTVRIRFERDPVLASIVGFSAESSTSRVDLSRALLSVERARLRVQQTTTETFEVALPLPGKEKSFLRGESPFNGQLPYGVRLAEDDEGVYVAHIAPLGTAADSRLLRVGDRIVATQGSTGEKLWPKKTLSGILSATNTRLSSSITFQIERKVELGAWEQRSSQVMPASPLDKVAYFSTSGAGITMRKRTIPTAATPPPPPPQSVTPPPTGQSRRRSTLSTSLVLLPDEHAWDRIQDIRLSHDRKVGVWPPHITLLRPFVRVQDFKAAADVLDQILNDFPPMTVRLEMQTFKHHDHCTSLWLVPDASSRDNIMKLQETIRANFPQCKRSKYLLRLLNTDRFMPHMTLGQFTTEGEAEVLKALYQEKLSGLSFEAKHVFLLSRADKRDLSADKRDLSADKRDRATSLSLQAETAGAAGPVEQLRVRLGPQTAVESAGLASLKSEYATLKKAGVELNASRTRGVLLERCVYDVVAFGKAFNVTGITEIVQGLKQNEIEMDSFLLNTVMGAYCACGHPQLAIEVFNNFTQLFASSDGGALATAATAATAAATAATAAASQSSTHTHTHTHTAAGAALGADSGSIASQDAAATTTAAASATAATCASKEYQALTFEASVHCYARLITALGFTGQLEVAHSVVERMVQRGPAPTIRIVNALLGACARQNNLSAAEKLFSSLTGERGGGFAAFVTPATDAGVCVALEPDAYSFNIMVNAYARAKKVEQAFRMLLEMRRAKCVPDKVTYSTLIKACVATREIARAQGLLDEMRELGMSDVLAYNALMAGLAKSKQWREILALLKRMEVEQLEPDLMTYSHAITACARAGKMGDAKKLFRTMEDQGIVPNRQVYSTLMSGFGASGALNEAQLLFKKMQERRVRPNEFTMSSLIEAYLKAGYAADALRLQERLPELGLKMDDVLETQSIRALSQLGRFENATAALLAFAARARSARGKGANVGPIPYNEVIKQAQQQQQLGVAKDVLAMMLKDKVVPNRKTYELLVALKDRSLQGMKRVQYFLDLIALVRSYSLKPLGPLYVQALQAAVDANEPELAGLLLDECADGRFSISKAEHESIEQLEVRVLNLMRMSADGKWYARVTSGRTGRLGSKGRLGSNSRGGAPFVTGSRLSGGKSKWDGEEYSANPQDRDFYSAEWW